MNITAEKTNHNPVLQAIKSIFNKMRQTPDVYPIKYYKKGKFRRHWQTPIQK